MSLFFSTLRKGLEVLIIHAENSHGDKIREIGPFWKSSVDFVVVQMPE